MNSYTMTTIIYLAEGVSKKRLDDGSIKPCKSYSELGLRIWGPRGKIIVDIAMFIAQFSCCVGYLYFIAGLLQEILLAKVGFDRERWFYIYLLLIPSIPISMIKTYTYLSYVSMFGIFGATIGGFMMIGFLSNKLSNDDYSHEELNLFDISSIFANIGITIFVFEGNGVVINLRAEAKNKK
jgi:amino acid permease